jgi:hypothetical protein
LCKTEQVHPLPANVSFAQGAAIGTPYATAYRGLLQRADAKPGETVLVHGASGGVGTAAVQLARARGLRVFGTAGSDEGIKLARQQGAHEMFDHRAPDHFEQIMKATGGHGVDVIVEMLANVNLASDLKLLRAVSWRVETAPPIIVKIHKPGKAKPDPFHGLYEAEVDGKKCVVEYEADSELRDTEQVPLLEPGGIEAFIRREVLPFTPDAWVDESATKIGYEISFTRHFYKPQPLRTLSEISADILALEKETEGLLSEIVKGNP